MDNGREFCNQHFNELLYTKGIKYELMVLYIPEKNGILERDNCTIMEAVRSMIYHAHLDPPWC